MEGLATDLRPGTRVAYELGMDRTGKMAAIAAMLDERITACVAGSTGVGGIQRCTYPG